LLIEAVTCGPYARAVAPDCIVPASYAADRPRRRRRRYRLRRLTPVGVAVVLAGAGGAWVGSHQRPEPVASAATPRVPALVAAPRVVVKKAAAPERLLAGGSLIAHRFSPGLLGAAAILVDARTGRVVWEQKAHERRHVASA